MTTGLLLTALTLVSPKDGETVPTLNDGQRAYLDAARSERFLRMDNMSDRAKLAGFGSAQQPVRIEWTAPSNSVCVVAVVSDRGERQSFVLTNRTSAYFTNLGLGTTYRWKVKCGDETSAAAGFVTEDRAPRLLRADGVGNFRDLGGWATADGRRVKQNMIFRSAGLRFSSKQVGSLFRSKVQLGERRITDAGIRTLRDEFHIRTDLELRSERETMGMTDSVLGKDVQWKCIPFVAYDFIDDLSRGRQKFAEIFRLFLVKENYPVLMHCSGGRDRTGTLAFLLNGLLGVGEDDLCRDWEMSVFAGQGQAFSSDLVVRLCEYLKGLPGATFPDRLATYAKSCGITDDELAKFRGLMLE